MVVGVHGDLSQTSVKLAVDIIADEFGAEAAFIFEKLIKNAPQSLFSLRSSLPSLPLKLIKESLLTLIQHNVVAFQREKSAEDSFQEDSYLYCAVPQNVHFRLRFGLYGQQLANNYGTIAKTLFSHLTPLGRASPELIFRKIVAATPVEDRTPEFMTELAEITKELIRDGIIKKIAFGPAGSNLQLCFFGGEELCLIVDNTIRSVSSTIDAMTPLPSDLLMTFDFESLNTALSIDHAIQFVSNRQGESCGRVFKACCYAMRQKVKDAHSVGLDSGLHGVSREDIHLQLVQMRLKNPSLSAVTTQELQTSLDSLCQDPKQYVTFTDENLYFIVLDVLLEELRLAQVESVVHTRFGRDSARLWRLLRTHPLLEPKQVADHAMINFKEARAKLSELLAARFVHIQEVPKSVDFAPSRTIHLWTIRVKEAVEEVIERTLGALKNARARIQHELATYDTLISKVLEFQTLQAAGLSTANIVITRDDYRLYSQVQNSVSLLQTTIARLDEKLLVLRDSHGAGWSQL
eukprot:GCRY01002949.1.p1 GENE.GCRY01002949.1~~GCRY01002949.1.p1  ORF type:complete len:520 (-),score=84.26 GCRY01002949.1:1593-3152(-)